MKLVVIGGGYVGLTVAACLASSENVNVVCLETNTLRVKQLGLGKCPIREPELEELIVRGLFMGNLSFTAQEGEAIHGADLFIVAVGTPSSPDGMPDLSQLRHAVKTIGKHLDRDATVIIKSTVPPGGTKLVQEWLSSSLCCQDLIVDVVYCPEFLREGHAVSDFRSPERLVIGSETLSAAQKTLALHRLCQSESAAVIFTSARNAELIKYASNAFLALKVAFVNELDELCENCKGDIRTVTAGMGLDSRIGKAYLRAGLGYGGACLPKDTQGLTWYARSVNSAMRILEQAIRSNEAHLEWIAEWIAKQIPDDAVIGVWGLTFKANTDDLRNSPAIALVHALSEKCGCRYQLFDPTVHVRQIDLLRNVNHTCVRHPEDAALNADALLIAVPWEEFKTVSLSEIKSRMRTGLIFDVCLLRCQDLPDVDGVSYIQPGGGVSW